MSVKIISVAKELPKYSRSTADILPLLDIWLSNQDDRFKRKVIKLFENAGVDKRYSIMQPEEVFLNTSFEEKNDIYIREVIKLGETALLKSLGKANLQPEDIDFIITVSCTGIMIPSLDAYLINRLKMKQDIVRLPVTEMGCAAGVSGIIYAKNFLKANPNKRAVVIAVESPTATFQLDDFSMVNIVSAAIFGDGAASVILSSYEDEEGPEIKDEAMYHFYDAEKRFIFALPAGGAHTRGMLENDPGILFPDHCFLFVAAGLYDQRCGDRWPDVDGAGSCWCQRYVVAHFYLFAVCLWRQRGLLRSHIL